METDHALAIVVGLIKIEAILSVESALEAYRALVNAQVST